MNAIKDDTELEEKKAELQRERDSTVPTNDPQAKEHHEAMINQLETGIQDFDVQWEQKMKASPQSTEANTGSLSVSGTTTESLNQSATEDRVPNIHPPKI